ncbi:hypothetical protein ABZW49_42540 [Nonomuraea wenchangensis]
MPSRSKLLDQAVLPREVRLHRRPGVVGPLVRPPVPIGRLDDGARAGVRWEDELDIRTHCPAPPRRPDHAHHDLLNDVQHRSVAAEIVTFLEALREDLIPALTVETSAW